MSRRKPKRTLLPCLSARIDCSDGRFIQVGNSLLFSERFQQLPAGAQLLYLCMCMEAGGQNSFTFTRATGAKYGIGNSTMRPNIDKLEAAGFITAVRLKNLRQPNEYQFSNEWKIVKDLEH